MLLLALWSDEYAQFEYRKKQYRLVTLRILNSPIVEDFFVGVFPSGIAHASFVFANCMQEISIWEIYMKVIVPDLYQLEHGVTLVRNNVPQRVIGTVHVIVGDNKEIQLLAGLHGTILTH